MKALDEVISGVEYIYRNFENNGCFDCNYPKNDCGQSCFIQDVLYYLKQFQEKEMEYEMLPDYDELIDTYQKYGEIIDEYEDLKDWWEREHKT